MRARSFVGVHANAVVVNVCSCLVHIRSDAREGEMRARARRRARLSFGDEENERKKGY